MCCQYSLVQVSTLFLSEFLNELLKTKSTFVFTLVGFKISKEVIWQEEHSVVRL